jgi:hypothetical protein
MEILQDAFRGPASTMSVLNTLNQPDARASSGYRRSTKGVRHLSATEIPNGPG